jgi:hypothetical protein
MKNFPFHLRIKSFDGRSSENDCEEINSKVFFKGNKFFFDSHAKKNNCAADNEFLKMNVRNKIDKLLSSHYMRFSISGNVNS